MLLQLFLTLLALLMAMGSIAALAMLLSWQETTASDCRIRLLTTVVPGVSALLLFLLGLAFGLFVLWSPAGEAWAAQL
ncbi:hypothetical protein FY528_16985 [Hymenobacter lutimineralis]|uniref:Uncharacterized protein n=1 Tax=Hymenobacter lutimineralis TaxID=2606448 RepID=A0A5D6UT78_9BACT|nr:hypothetical protein [Hymenobacter lutimineralis]TYZ06756.1 hypothetical protein FY528_16985 [Hymenobacter lutimineralis]